MRKVVMIVSLVSFVFLSTDLIIRVLTNPVALLWPAWPWLLSLLLMIAGFVVLLAALILYVIYWYRQERAQEQQWKQWGIVAQTTQDLLRCKAEEARPYKREVWLQIALFVSLGIVMISRPVMDLIILQGVLPSSVPYKATFDAIFLPGAPASILICTFLSRDLAKKSET